MNLKSYKMSSAISAELITAYRQTDYIVMLESRKVVFHIDKYSATLLDLHCEFNVISSAFITAYNPLGEIHSPALNASRQDQLECDLDSTGFVIIRGIGQHPEGRWPGEPALLVLGIPRDEACELGKKYEQNAIVYSAEDAIPKLILLR